MKIIKRILDRLFGRVKYVTVFFLMKDADYKKLGDLKVSNVITHKRCMSGFILPEDVPALIETEDVYVLSVYENINRPSPVSMDVYNAVTVYRNTDTLTCAKSLYGAIETYFSMPSELMDAGWVDPDTLMKYMKKEMECKLY